MPKILFRGATLRHVTIQDDEAGVFTRIHVSADYSDTVARAMEWEEKIADGITSAKLEGSLNATNLVLTPNGNGLKQNEVKLDVSEVADFQFFRSKPGEDGGAVETELRFVILCNQPGAAALLEDYKRTVGKGKAALRVGYEEQSELPLETTYEQREAVSAEKD
jgi:hypothetical protein